MRISFTAVALVLAMHAAPALADRDPQSGAPLAAEEARDFQSDHRPLLPRVPPFTRRICTPTLRIDPAHRRARCHGHDLQRRERLWGCRTSWTRVAWSSCSACAIATRCASSTTRRIARATRCWRTISSSAIRCSSPVSWRRPPSTGSQFDITYTYSFIRNEHFEVGTGLAVYFLQVDVIIDQPQPFAIALHQEVSGASPFPALPLDLTWCISQPLVGHGARGVPEGNRQWYSRLVRRLSRGPAVPLEPELRGRRRLLHDPHLAHPQAAALSPATQSEHQRTRGVHTLQLLAAHRRGRSRLRRRRRGRRHARTARACAPHAPSRD